METALTEDALLGGSPALLQSRRGYRGGYRRRCLLAARVDAESGERVLDLGAGVGAVGLCLARALPDCTSGRRAAAALAALAERNAA
jgi:tRNA1(Val) A37 N6-methylase TrmN6